jgi:ornithine carbamoyltransferase
MITVTPARHLLRIADLDHRELGALLDLAERMKAEPDGWREALSGSSVACYFTKPSTRTRVSVEAACFRLGALPIMLRPDELQLGRGEPIADTARVLSGYCSAIVVRTFAQSDVEALAVAASVPVVNALTDEHHPCQALADLLTLRERFGSLAGLRLAYIGDGNNVAHSLLEAGALAGMHVTVASPVGFWPRAEVLERATAFARSSGGSVSVVSDPRDTVGGANAVYTDVWVSMGQDEESERRREELSRFRVDAALMSRAADDAIFLHCLPAHRGQEVAADVIDGPRSAVWQQAANRLPTEQALLYALVTGDWAGEEQRP